MHHVYLILIKGILTMLSIAVLSIQIGNNTVSLQFVIWGDPTFIPLLF